MGSEKPLLTFVAEEEWIKQVDDFRFQKRFKSRAAAIKWLVTWALSRNPQPTEQEVKS